MILMRPQEAFLVSGPFYKNLSLDEGLPEFNNPPFNHNDLEPGGGWQHEISKHYGRDGYAVLMLRHTNPAFQHYFRFRAIRLFNIRKDWSSYDHVSSVPRRLLGRLPYRVTHECHVEQNGTKVNIIMVVGQDPLGDSDDDDDDEAEEEEEEEGEGGVGVADEEGVGVGDLNQVGTNGVGAEDSDEDQDQTENQDLDNGYASEDWDDEDEEDIDIDARHWNLMHFIYDIPTQEWTSTFFSMRDYEDVGDPVFTSRLMLGVMGLS
uniref:uncharacterized protein LOC122595789 isoform X1 n=1 Tax=Erigeron canadensis TaxID=72917 RepID=UPI001CB91998|nr:uncharacterized protein LOC122595789 isoform X1 [Erigeron canadensis]